MGPGSAFPQDVSPEDPDAPQARREIVPVSGIVTQLRGDAPRTQGRRESIQGSRVNIQGALNDLGATVTGKEIKISLNTNILFDFDHADLKPEAGPPLQKVAAVVALYLNRRQWPFTALNSWTGSRSAAFNSGMELHLNRGLPGSAVYDLSTVRQQLELSVVGLTNTTAEEMAGVFPLAIRDAIYRAIA
jgi:hypothetical protein